MEKKGLRLLLFDAAACPLPAKWNSRPLLLSWRLGAIVYSLMGRFDACYGGVTWEKGLSWLGNIMPDRKIAEIQYWGHGYPGCLILGKWWLNADALDSTHPLNPALGRIARRIEKPESLWWFRTCMTFQGEAGHSFARAWSTFFGCRTAGFTRVIGPFQGGLHSLRPGCQPQWPLTEGLEPSRIPKPLSWGPNTITFLTGSIPENW